MRLIKPVSLSTLLCLAYACGSSQSAVNTSAAPTPAAKKSAFTYPDTRRQDIVDTLHGVAVPDPYRWLEDAKKPDVTAWMKAQDKLARDYLGKRATRAAWIKRLTQLYYVDSVSAPRRRGKNFFYSRRHKDKEKRVTYWRAGEKGAEKVLLDPNTWSKDGSVSMGGYFPSPDGKLVAYRIKKNNADHADIHIMEVATGKKLPDVIDGARYGYPSWTPDNKGFFYTRIPMDSSVAVADLPGKAHVRYHRLGDDAAKDAVWHPPTNNPRAFIRGRVSTDGRWLVVKIQHGWAASDVYFKKLDPRKFGRSAKYRDKARNAKFTTLVEGVKARFRAHVWKDRFYVFTNHEAPNGKVMKVDPKRPEMQAWKLLVPESARAAMRGAGVIGGHLQVTYLENARSKVEIRSLDGKKVRHVQLPGIGSGGTLIGREDDDVAYFGFSSYNTPHQIYKTSVKSGKPSLFFKIDVPIDLSGIQVDQVWYPSKDGTKISMFLIRHKDTSKSGANPTILYGYGGFNISLTPRFRSSIAAWLERGGMYAIANLRGGGEYGEKWHKAGMLLKKQNVFDDFESAARYLINEGWTKPDKLAIYGGSNGGLLVGAAMVQAPELYKAVVCSVPLLDMVRYHLFGSGKTWIPEYGSAEDPAQFKAIQAYSPYHHVKKGTKYPSLLMLSADTDDRVDPMHARKFIAQIQWATTNDAPAIIRIEKNAGHGGADMVKASVARSADLFAYLSAMLGLN